MHLLLDLVGGFLSFIPSNANNAIVLLHMLNLIERYPLRDRNGLNVHRLVEIMKFGFAAR